MTEVSAIGVSQNAPISVSQQHKEEQTKETAPQNVQPEIAPEIVDKAAADAISGYALASINAQTPKSEPPQSQA